MGTHRLVRARSCAVVLLAAAATVLAASCGGSSAADDPPATEDAGDKADRNLPDTDPPEQCALPKVSCGAGCVDLQTDTKHCGKCLAPCKGAEQCITGTCKLVTGFAVRKVFLGETDRTGAASGTAWKAYGRNIDGLVTVGATPTTECKRISGASSSSQDDGNDGIDNSFGRNFIPFLTGLTPTPSKNTSDLLEAGGRTPMLSFGDPPKQDAPAFALGLVTAENTVALKWDGTDSRPVADSSVTAGKAKITFASATTTAGAFDTGASTQIYVLDLSFGGSSLSLPIRLARVTMKIAADGKTATEGVLSGVIKTSEFEAAFEKVAGQISTQLCPPSSTLDTIKQTIRNSSDILADGTQDATKDCDGVSIGIGFEAAVVAVGPVAAPVGPVKDPCVP